VLDVGCWTGTFALLLADRGLEVTSVEPAGGSLDAARAKRGPIMCTGSTAMLQTCPPMQVDLLTMTANVAQAILGPPDWEGTLHGVFDELRPGGHFVLETRDPAYRAWQEWNRGVLQHRGSHRHDAGSDGDGIQQWSPDSVIGHQSRSGRMTLSRRCRLPAARGPRRRPGSHNSRLLTRPIPSENFTVVPVAANPARATLKLLARNQAPRAPCVVIHTVCPLGAPRASFADLGAGSLGKLVISTR
jgi:hypothetical protein